MAILTHLRQEHLLEAARVCSESPIELSSMIEMKNTIQALRYFYPTAFYPRRASSSYPPTPPGDENHINTTKDEIFRLNCALPSPLIIGELRKLATFKHKYESNHYTLPLETLDYFLRRSIRASLHSLKKGDPGAPRVGILFSGGLDCSCICALVHLYLPPGEPIDLINVSFDGKRTPDRKSALESYKELRKVYPSRVWNLIKVDVCEEECIKVQKKMKTLIYPCYESLYMVCMQLPKHAMISFYIERAVLIFSPYPTPQNIQRLAFAFWFASRAHGTLESTGYEYCSRSKVLFSGLGADRIVRAYNSPPGVSLMLKCLHAHFYLIVWRM